MTKRKTRNNDWYRIEALAGGRSAEIHIMEQIGEDFWTGEGMTAKKFAEELRGLDVDVINLHINSPGGSVFDGQTIYSQLRNHKALVNVHIDGLAASIASVIAMAGDTVTMPRNAMMMIHDPSGYARGTAEDMRKTASALDKVKQTIIAAYQDKTGLEDVRLAELMSDETWMTADEAVELGFADQVSAPVDMQASAGFSLLERFENIPRGLFVNISPAPHKPTAKEESLMAGKENGVPEITLDLIRASHPAIITAIVDEATAQLKADNDAAMGAARKEAADAERERIKSVRSQSLPGHEALIETLMFDGVTTGEQAAVKVLQAENATRQNTLRNMQQDGELNVPAAGEPPVQPKTAGSVEDRARAEWDKDAGLQSEFNNNFKSYLAWFSADVARKEA